MFLRKLGTSLLIIGTLYGCASAHRSAQQDSRKLIASAQYAKALESLEKSDFKKEEKSQLLYLLEKGLLEHTMGKFSESLTTLEAAKKLSGELFTKSVSQKVTTAIANDNYENFYGAYYERSLIHFYLSLNHLMLSQSSEGNDKQKHLVAARAEILLWDSLLKSFRDNRLGKSVYKDDMVSKIYGAKVHEFLGGFNNEQIALQLYKDAAHLLLKNYNAYKSYNLKFKEFKSDFDKFATMNLNDVKANYISATALQKEFKAFLDYQILMLTLKIRAGEKKNVIREFDIEPATVTKVESDQKLKNEADIMVLVQSDLIPEKIGKEYNIGIDGAVNAIEDKKTQKVIREVGIPIISIFAAETLGLTPKAENWSLPGAYLGIITTQVALSTWGIEFELPKVLNDKPNNSFKLEIYNEAGDKLISEQPLVLVEPLNDMAEEGVEEDASANYIKTGSRVAVKHILALITAYKTYQLLKQRGGAMEFLARNAALIEYMGASKVIKATEKADTRYWSSLPKTINMQSLKLVAGKYKLKVKELNESGAVVKTSDLGITEIKANDKKILNFRI